MIFRLYVNRNSEDSVKAVEWFREQGLLDSVVEVWNAGNDPIVCAGIAAYGNEYPILVSFVPVNGQPGEVITGFDPEVYRRAVDYWRTATQSLKFCVTPVKKDS